MKYAFLSILIGLGIALTVGWSVYENTQRTSGTADQTNTYSSTTTIDKETVSSDANNTDSSGITMSTITQHNSASSCWVAVKGSVYDLTSWIPNHPGGEQAILQLCGTDGSAKFDRQHGGDNRVQTVLAGFKIGALAQ